MISHFLNVTMRPCLLAFYTIALVAYPTITALTAQELDKMLHQYANTARKTATPSSLYLSQPIPHSEAVAQAMRFTPLAAWGIFNPFGPTIASLFLIEVPATQEQLLFLRTQHPSLPFAIIYGLLPKQIVQDEVQLRKTLERLFDLNGSEEYPLLDDLPSFIKAIKESPISETILKELFFRAAVVLRGQNLDETCDLLKKFMETHGEEPKWSSRLL